MMGSKVEILDVMKRLHEASDPLRQVMYTEAECNDDNLRDDHTIIPRGGGIMRGMKRLSFRTKQQVVEYLREKKGLSESEGRPGIFSPVGTYVTAHGEYARPEYKPVRYGDGWGVKGVHFWFPRTYGAPRDKRIEWDVWE